MHAAVSAAAALNPVLLLLRWAGFLPPMWKRRTDFAGRVMSVLHPFTADCLQRLACESSLLDKTQRIWLTRKRLFHLNPPHHPRPCPLTDSNMEQMSSHRFQEHIWPLGSAVCPPEARWEALCPDHTPGLYFLSARLVLFLMTLSASVRLALPVIMHQHQESSVTRQRR